MDNLHCNLRGIADLSIKIEIDALLTRSIIQENSYYKRILYEPDNWRQGIDLPKIQGLIVGCQDIKRKTYALVDDGDVHTLLIGASGIGKTAFFSTQTWSMPVRPA